MWKGPSKVLPQVHGRITAFLNCWTWSVGCRSTQRMYTGLGCVTKYWNRCFDLKEHLRMWHMTNDALDGGWAAYNAALDALPEYEGERLRTWREKHPNWSPISSSRKYGCCRGVSFLYQIVTGKRPYNELEVDDVEKLFERADSLSTTNIHLGRTVRGYQHGKFWYDWWQKA